MKILIVDNKKKDRSLLESLLKAHKQQVESAANGADALEILRAGSFEMIISDILMPVMDGLQLCRECKKDRKLRAIPFVFYTATYTDEKDEEVAMSLGAARFIRKPVEPAEFIAAIQDVVRDAQAGRIVKPEPVAYDAVLRLYNERLVKKLEEKKLDLEREIVERRRFEEKLRESEQRYRIHFENITDVIFSYDREFRIMNTSPSVVRTLGYKPSELVGRIFLDLGILTSESLSAAALDGKLVLSGKRIVKNSYHFIAKGGAIIHGEIISSPLMNQGQIEGVLCVARDVTQREKAEAKLLNAMHGTIEAISRTVEIRDPYTAGHQKRVTQLALSIAHELGVDEDGIETIRWAGIVHDIGKIYVPLEILSKPGRLSGEEFNLIKIHPQAGYDILKDIDFPWPIELIVLQHHERMNSSGYPSNMNGREISLEARILAVADVMEAMASHRPYRSARGVDRALEELSKNKGILYDPDIVDVCVRLFKEKRFHFNELGTSPKKPE